MKKLFLLTILLLVFFRSITAMACECVKQTEEELANGADVIFIGKLIEIDNNRNSAIFKVSDCKKGGLSGEISLGGVAIAVMCDLRLKKDVDYLVYGYKEKKKGNFILTGCNTTKPITEASEKELNLVNNL